MEKDPNIIAIARSALAEFGSRAAAVIEKRRRDHALAKDKQGEELWRRVGKALRAVGKETKR